VGQASSSESDLKASGWGIQLSVVIHDRDRKFASSQYRVQVGRRSGDSDPTEENLEISLTDEVGLMDSGLEPD
jgi:hypothetical protein